MAAPVLQVDDLRVGYQTARGRFHAVDGVDFTIAKGEILGLIGESGCGKTTTAMAVLRLVQQPGSIDAGRVVLDGETDVLSLDEEALRELRWRGVSLVPQGALNSLNPLLRIRDQIADVIQTHEGHIPRAERDRRILELFATVGLPARVVRLYPHELSGGMRQRACIAMAIALGPSLVIADEPTSALDVIVQRVVAQTLLDVKRRLGIAFLLIGHDIGLMAQLADRVAVMYRGKIVEMGPTDDVFSSPRHPYTQLLIEAVPTIGRRATMRLGEGPGPDLLDQSSGCVFRVRCPHAFEQCHAERPALSTVGTDHLAACHLATDGVRPPGAAP